MAILLTGVIRQASTSKTAIRDNEFGVCMVCFEDLKPLSENLQVISICGHVFHQLCLQQWLEYSVANNTTCPVCRQTCSQENIRRLYFQSIGDGPGGDTTDHDTQNLPAAGKGTQEDEVKKLQGKLLVLTSSFEHQQRKLKDMSEELNKLKDVNKEFSKCNGEMSKEIVFYKALLKFFFLLIFCTMVYSFYSKMRKH
ncbi:hypothetical protein C5167_030964 [Papaver somniferum]|nr:hypothetical protein C5167_030964 [Papaver somniferum]